MKCYKGTILSVDSNNRVYKYLVEENGKILYTGNEMPEKYSNAEVIDLGNKALAPAFIDTHQHFASLSTFNAGMNVMEAESNGEIAKMIGEYAAKTDKKTIIVFGASPHSVKEGCILYYSDEKVIEFCKKANRLGLQIELHAIGDKAFDQAARALKAALDDCPRNDHRHGIIHCCLPTKEGIAICKEYKIQMPVQSAFIGWKQEPDSYLEELLGTERTSRLNPIRTNYKPLRLTSFTSTFT